MSLLEWAKKEIELATNDISKEPKSDFEGDTVFSYEKAIYQSALKAFESLVNNEHSGFSIQMTRDVLNRLIDCKPLTPIKGLDDEWNFVENDDGILLYQCNRYSALFKRIMSDGTIRYNDNNRFVFHDINDYNTPYHNGFLENVMTEIVGDINMPYYPSKSIHVNTSIFLTYPENGDYDTIAIFYYKDISGDVKDVSRYFKFNGDNFEEIDKEEYDFRKYLSCRREILEKIKKIDGITKQRIKDSIMQIFVVDLDEDSLD